MSGDFHAKGSGDFTRSLWFRDSSKADEGESGELGWGRGVIVGVVGKIDADSGIPTEIKQAWLQPRNWHVSEGDAIDPDFPGMKDRRLSVALVSDFEHDFQDWTLTPKDARGPFLDDWAFSQKSTRIVDYGDPKGRVALFAQHCKVVDDHTGQYTAATPFTRQIGQHETAAAGYLWDDVMKQSGLLDTVFLLNSQDVYGTGRDGHPWGILGLRTDAHWEFVNEGPHSSGGNYHGRIYFDVTDVSKYAIPKTGSPFKVTMAWDPTAAGTDSGLGHEQGEWRPWYRVPNIVAPVPPFDGPVAAPGDPVAGLPGGVLSLPYTADPPSTNVNTPSPTTHGNIALVSSGGTTTIKVSNADGSWSAVSGGGSTLSPCFYGDGSDGAGVADGATAITGCTLAANVYTQTRDVQLTSLTVSNGVTVDTHGYRLLVAGTATINAGGIVSNNATQRLSTNFGSIANGGAGGFAVSTPGNGGNLGTVNVSLGGAGGGGGNAGANTGGSGMAANRPSAANGTYRAMPFAMLGYVMNPNQTATWLSLNGGGGGGSGALAAGATNSSSGAGGGGAGIMVFTAKLLTNNGTISANGFAGANAVAGADGIAAGGGGGGGGGGLLLAAGSGSTFGTTQVNGGALGTGANGGANGVAGSVGTVVTLCG